MEKVGIEKGCLGDASFEAQTIAGGEWTGEGGGQYRLTNQNLEQSFATCLASANCTHIWIADSDEESGWGSRAVPACAEYDQDGHNVFAKVCAGSHRDGGGGQPWGGRSSALNWRIEYEGDLTSGSDIHLYGKGVGKYLHSSSADGRGTVWGDKDDSANWRMEWVSTIRPQRVCVAKGLNFAIVTRAYVARQDGTLTSGTDVHLIAVRAT
jgi:hypothetical protein